jgi:DNA polymerase III delta subunit
VKIEDALSNLPQASVYFAYGNGLFSKWQLRKKLERLHKVPKVVVFGDDLEIIDKAECGGLIPEPKLVIVENFSEIKNKKYFLEMIERACEGSVYLLTNEKKEKILLSKNVVEIDCSETKQNEREFLQTIKNWLKGSSLTLNDQSLKKIFSVTNGDLFHAFNEIQKAALYAQATNAAHLSLDELKTLMGPRFDSDPFSFSNFYLQKKLTFALNEIKSWKTTDVMLQLHNHFKAVERSLLAMSCKKKNMKVEKITEETGIPSWYLKYTFPEIESKWSEKELIGALRDCTIAIHKAKTVVNIAIPVMMESVLRRCKFGGNVE